MVDKHQMTEEEIKLRYITPTIEPKWGHDRMRMEYYFTDGRIILRGKKATRGERKFADYLLSYKANIPLAIIEVKDNNHPVVHLQLVRTYSKVRMTTVEGITNAICN